MKFKLSIINCQLSIILALALFFSLPVRAQVTIGEQKNPEDFSILELSTEKLKGGLRLPQLTKTQRNALSDTWKGTAQAGDLKGLVIYNTDNNCLEFWSGTDWISMCANVINCGNIPALSSSYTLCNGSTIADLTNAAGGHVIWYDNEGNIPPVNTALNNNSITTLYAYRIIPACNISITYFKVEVELGNCSTIPASGNVTTFTNVMYDFQHQKLEVYWNGGIPNSYKWQVSTDNVTYDDIPIAPNSKYYTVLADFIHKAEYTDINELFFRCVLTNPAGATNSNPLGIEFIRTTDGTGNLLGGYKKDANDVRYITINRGGNLNGGKINIALLNLGANEDNDAGDLGDLYQWGRVADGHEKIVWIKNSIHANTFTSGVGGTSDVVAYDDASHINPSTGQVYDPNDNLAGLGFYGNFINSVQDWGTFFGNTLICNDRWGNTFNDRANAPVSLSGWTSKAQANNPCPTGWRIPSRYEFWDIYRGDGITDPTSITNGAYDTNVTSNPWRWRNLQTNSIGGVIITNNATDAKVYLPAAGQRVNTGVSSVVHSGSYWSSTHSTAAAAYLLSFDSGSVNAATGFGSMSSGGMSIRCVAD